MAMFEVFRSMFRFEAFIHSVHPTLLFPLQQQPDFQNKLQSHMQALQYNLSTVRDTPSNTLCHLLTLLSASFLIRSLLLCLLRQKFLSPLCRVSHTLTPTPPRITLAESAPH